jgi:hypothetical protein
MKKSNILLYVSKYRISQPIRHFFPLKNVTEIQPVSYVPRVSLISKLINTHTSIIEHLYRNYDFSGSDDDFWISMMNKLYIMVANFGM